MRSAARTGTPAPGEHREAQPAGHVAPRVARGLTRPFRTHLLGLVLAVALPLVALAGGLLIWTTEARRAEALRGVDQTSHALQLAVDRELRVTIAALEALATSPAVDEALAAGPGGAGVAPLHRQATALIARRPAALSVIWLTPADWPVPVLNTLVPPGVPPPRPLAGASFPPRPIGPPPAPLETFRRIVAERVVHVGDLAHGPLTGWTVVVAVPVLRGDRVVGVLGAGLSPASIGEVLREQIPPTAGAAAVADRGGVLIARTAEEERFVGHAGAAETIAFLRSGAGEAQGEATSLDGTRVYAAFRRLTIAPFAVAYGAPRAVVDAPVRRALAATSAGALLALLLAAGAALWLGRRLGAEVAGLGADALTLARGEAPPDRPQARVQEVAAARSALLRSAASLAESELRFNRAVAAARIGTWEWDATANRLTGSPGREALYGRAPGSLPTREALLAAVHPEDRAMVDAAAHRALSWQGDGIYEAEFRTVWPDGTIRWLRTRGLAEFDAEGRPLRMSGAVVDVTERRLAEAALRESERRLRLAQEAAGIGVWERDLASGKGTWSEQEYRVHGLDPSQPPPDAATLRAMLVGEDADRPLLFERLRDEGFVSEEAGAPRTAEYCIRRADDGELRWVQVVGRALPGPDGRPARVVGVSLDITDRRAAEQRQALLVREVDHRAKNALAVALSVVQVAPRDLPPEVFAAAVTGRIAAMARAHSLLAAERWSGADLRILAEGEMAAHAGRVVLDGPPLRLAPDAAQPVAMLLHELATNAIKHGALAAPSGRVLLSWRLGERLELTWREQGGLALRGAPQRAGFGSRLLSLLVERQLGGALAFDWSGPDGLVATIRLPLRHVATPEAMG